MKKWHRAGVALAFLFALSFLAGSPVRAGDTCPAHLPVLIDIKPGSYPNSINLKSRGVVPVAILSTAEFDASEFSPVMAHLGDADSTDMSCPSTTSFRTSIQDVNGDGRLDLLLFLDTSTLKLTASTTAATLMAHGSYQGATIHVMGTDSVVIVQ